MGDIVLHTIVALCIFGYFGWAAFSVYFVMIGKKVEDGATIVGKLIWYHGLAMVFLMVGVAALTMSLLLSKYIWAVMGTKILIGQ